jgi:hypothetical protein
MTVLFSGQDAGGICRQLPVPGIDSDGNPSAYIANYGGDRIFSLCEALSGSSAVAAKIEAIDVIVTVMAVIGVVKVVPASDTISK